MSNTIHFAQIADCPQRSLLPGHYREDGSCRCEEPDEEDLAHAGCPACRYELEAPLQRGEGCPSCGYASEKTD